jgi:pimeloyl-ACP methyl ester carboxylesterase
MLKNWLCLLLAFLFFSYDAFAVITRGGSAGAPTASAGPPSFVQSAEDIINHCSVALTEKFGEIKGVSLLVGMHAYDKFSYTVWCQIRDDECQLFHINGSAEAGVSLKLLQPEGPELYFTEYKPYEKIMQFRAKNPEKTDEILCWEFDYTNWKFISEDDWIYSHDEHMQKIQALYPGHACNIKYVEKEKVLAFLTDPLNVSVERAVVFRRLQTAACEQIELFTARADSIRTDGLLVNYKGIDGNPYAKKINLESLTLEEALPAHPLGLRWCELAFNEAGNLLFARYTLLATLIAQYWTIQNGNWKLLHEGQYPAQILSVSCADHVYRHSYTDTGLTLEWLNSEGEFEPTNVNNFSIQLICGEFKTSAKNPREILALQNYSEGKLYWHFPTSGAPILKVEYDHYREELHDYWRRQGKHYADRSISIESLNINEHGHLDKLFVGFPENVFLKCRVNLNGVFSKIWSLCNEDQFHQPLQIQKVDIEGEPIPYFYAPPEPGTSNNKTIVMMEGGPEGAYTGGYSPFVKAFTQAGWSVILPQESLRTGHGWKHYSKGIGEMGRKNLHQLLHIFHDAIGKSLIPNQEQVHLYGSSYGGFVAASFALRWDFLHAQAGLPKLFNFQSIVADAACVDSGLVSWSNREAILGTMDLETFRRSFMPLHLEGPTLSAPLTLVHGKVDIRCSANDARAFSTALKTAAHPFDMFWHNGGHNFPDHERYPEFLLELMEGRPVTDIATAIGLIQEV